MATPAPDYSLIWAANSPLSPYTFSSENYLTGWNFIGAIPPDRRQFDAWFKLTDEKTKWLYDNDARKSDLEEIKQYVKANGGVPAGTIISYAGQTDPDGWLLCDGSAVSRTTYADLFAAIGTLYGSGDGSTTFNLPNLTDKFLQGSTTPGTEKAAGLPNIKGDLALHRCGTQSASGAFKGSTASSGNSSDTTLPYGHAEIKFRANNSNPIYGASDTVQPPAVTVRFLIKAAGSTSGGTASDSDVQDMLDNVFG